ncbi:MAG: hypothetical protein IKJ74_04835 [Clostridia bacterium]|nr:hypothetical protein [Clostridia bacterium]
MEKNNNSSRVSEDLLLDRLIKLLNEIPPLLRDEFLEYLSCFDSYYYESYSKKMGELYEKVLKCESDEQKEVFRCIHRNIESRIENIDKDIEKIKKTPDEIGRKERNLYELENQKDELFDIQKTILKYRSSFTSGTADILEKHFEELEHIGISDKIWEIQISLIGDNEKL